MQAWCSHPPPSVVAAAKRAARSVLAADLGPRAALLHTVMIRRTLFFPDRRLVQFDCGKLQELYLRKNAVSSCTQSQCARSRVRLGARMLCGYAARQLT